MVAVIHHRIAGRAAHASDHGGGADIQALVLLKGNGHIEEQFAGQEVQFQLLAGFTHLALAGCTQLNSLAAVETDVGVAAFTRLDLGAAVQTHSVSQAQALPAGTFDRDSALRLFQAERGPDSRRSCGGHR